MGRVLCPVLVGRDEESARLRALVERAAAGRGGAALLLGEAGSGKTRLATEAVACAAARGGLVLTGRSVPSPVPVPFRALTEALQSALRRGDPPDLGAYGPAVARLLPEVGPAAVPEREVVSLVVVAEGVLRLLRALRAGRPLVLLVEDLHWADAETLAVLEYLVDHAAEEGVLLLLTAREEGGAAGTLAAALEAGRRAEVVRLDRLGPADVARFVRACLGQAPEPDLLAAVAERAEGLPLFLEELLAAGSLTTAVPSGFLASVRARLGALDAEDRRAVECAAVLGRQVDWCLVAEATAPPEGVDRAHRTAVLRGLRAAADAQLLVADAEGGPGGLRFRHALTRDAVLADVFAPDRAALAGAGLAALRRRDPTLPGGACQHAADLAEEAGAADEAVGLLVEAARRGLRAGALRSAESLLDRARRLVSSDPEVRVVVDELLVEVLALGARADRVFDVGRVLLARLDSVTDPARVAQVHLRLAQAALDAAQPALAREHLDAAGALAGEHRDAALLMRADLVAADLALGEYRLDEAEALASWASQAAWRLGRTAARCEAELLLGRVQRERDPDAAERTFARALAEAEGAGLPVLRVRALAELGSLDVTRAQDSGLLLVAAEQAEAVGAVAVAGVARLHAAVSAFQLGDQAACVAHTDEARALTSRYGLGFLGPAAGMVAACASAARGEAAAMEERLAEALPGVADEPEWVAIGWGARAVARLGVDDREGATAALHRAADVGLRRILGTNPHYSLGVLLDVVAGADLDRHPLRTDVAAGRCPRGLLAAARAVTLGRQGDAPGAARVAGEAEDLLGPTPWYRHVALRHVAECALDDGWGEPERWLRETEAWAEAAGLPRLADGCRRLLRRAGVRVPRQARADGAAAVPPALRGLGVTTREADVLTLVAEGASNRDIAARLFLSPRTVEKHVERLLAKTGTASRTELAVRAVALEAPAGPLEAQA